MKIKLAIMALLTLFASLACAFDDDLNPFNFSFKFSGQRCIDQIPVGYSNMTSLAFGNVSTGQTRTLAGTYTNIGKGYISSVYANLSSSTGGFRLYSSTCVNATLNANQSCNYKTAFTPVAAGAVSNVAFIDSDQFDAVRVPVSGTGIASDACSGSPDVGTICADGTVYAGLSPDGDVPMFVTRCDVGQTWDGSSCTGTRSSIAWAAGGSVFTAATSNTSGSANTATLIGLSNADTPYSAAAACSNLSSDGKTDWYLPARDELLELYTNRVAIGNFYVTDNTLDWYWSSTQVDSAHADIYQFGTGTLDNKAYYAALKVRCVRK